MTTVQWIVLGAVAWLIVSVPAGILVGRRLKRNREQLIIVCGGCGQMALHEFNVRGLEVWKHGERDYCTRDNPRGKRTNGANRNIGSGAKRLGRGARSADAGPHE